MPESPRFEVRGLRSALLATRVLSALAVLLYAAASVFAGPVIDLYERPGCPHCAEARRHLDTLVRERPEVSIREYDVTADPAALERLREISVQAGVKTPGVPTLVIAGTVLVGFDPAVTPARIRAALASADALPDTSPTAEGKEPAPAPAPGAIDLPLVGRVDVDALGLPLFTIIVGLLDGFNPCATWVLLFLLAMLVNLKSRSRMALIAGTFVVVSGIVYFAFMAAWLNLFLVLDISRTARPVLAAIAMLIGAIHVKDFFAAGRGPSLSIPERAKPGIYRRVREVLHAENLAGAMAGIITLAFLVNLVELLCTAGLPALYTAILTNHMLPAWSYYSYLTLYIVAYMFDDAILVGIGVITLTKRKLQERGGRWLKLVSGVVMLCLGLLLLVQPTVLGF